MNSLSIAAADAKTFDPTYGIPGHLEQALDRAVLAECAVQHREDDVDVAECPGALGRIEHHETVRRGVAGQDDG